MPKKNVKLGSKAKKEKVSLEVQVNDSVYKGGGKTLAEALANYAKSPEFPVGVKTFVVFKYGSGKSAAKRLLPVSRARGIFNRLPNDPQQAELLAISFERDLKEFNG